MGRPVAPPSRRKRTPREGHSAMTVEEIVQTPQFRSVVEDYRDTCLWFANDPEHPVGALQLEQVLTEIEKNGDMAAFRRVGEIRKWLPRNFRPKYSSGSPVRG